MNIRVNSHTKRANIPLPGWQAQCMHMPDMAIMPRWWRIFAAGLAVPGTDAASGHARYVPHALAEMDSAGGRFRSPT
jgi:hypothetical protein